MRDQETINETIKDNELFAEFLGFFKAKVSRGYAWDNNKIVKPITLHGTLIGDKMNGKFHLSWDWMMVVIEKIEGYCGASVLIGRFFCQIDYTDPLDEAKTFSVRIASGVKLNAVNGAALKFIQWWNEHKK